MVLRTSQISRGVRPRFDITRSFVTAFMAQTETKIHAVQELTGHYKELSCLLDGSKFIIRSHEGTVEHTDKDEAIRAYNAIKWGTDEGSV